MKTASGNAGEDASIEQVRRNLTYLMDGNTYGAAIGLDERKSESLYALGHAQYVQGHYSEAMTFFGFILSCDPLNYRAMQAMASCLQMTGKHGQALLLLGVLLVGLEDNKEVSMQMINCLIHLDRHAEAVKVIGAVEAALKDDPEDMPARQRLAGYRQLAERALALS